MATIDWQALPETAKEFKDLYGDAPVIHPDDREDIELALAEMARYNKEWLALYESIFPSKTDDSDDDEQQERFDALLLEDTSEENLREIHTLFNKCYTACEHLDEYVYMCTDIHNYSYDVQREFAANLRLILYSVRDKEVNLFVDVIADVGLEFYQIKKRCRREQNKESPSKRVFIDLSED